MMRLLTTITFLTTLLYGSIASANNNILNVYNWSSFMPSNVIKQFEKETGIHVNYSEFDSNETLYTKLKADPHVGFDIVVPSSYYVERMHREGMLRPLDKTKLTNLKYINPTLLNKSFDPHNRYSLPYFWGSTGIVVNDRYFNPKKFYHWNELWKKRYKNQLLILDDPREAFSTAMVSLGYSVNDRSPQHIKQAYLKLKKLMPNIKLFNSDAEDNIYIDEDAVAGIGWSGDIYLSWQENKHLHFIYPYPRFPLWIDCIAIPKYAPHYQNALRFINFLMRPKIAKEIAMAEGYSSPNVAAMKMLPKSMRDNPILNPSQTVLKRSEVEADLGPSDAVYQKYWQLLKLGE